MILCVRVCALLCVRVRVRGSVPIRFCFESTVREPDIVHYLTVYVSLGGGGGTHT